MKWLKAIAALLLAVAGSCTVSPTTPPSPTPTPAISREKGIAIAATQVPLPLVERGAVYTLGNSTTVVFEGVDATKEDLGWQLDGKTVFQEDYPNSGPPGVYATLMITTNASTGEIEKRSALKLPNGGYVAVSGTPSSRFGCTRPTPSPTQTPAISREKAIAIAATQIPLDLVAHSAVNADDASGWRVSFQQANTTRQDLAWPDDGKNVFQSEGSANVPPGVFATIVIIVSPSNGEIINRIATNSILLGKPGPVTKTVNQGWWNGWSCNR